MVDSMALAEHPQHLRDLGIRGEIYRRPFSHTPEAAEAVADEDARPLVHRERTDVTAEQTTVGVEAGVRADSEVPVGAADVDAVGAAGVGVVVVVVAVRLERRYARDVDQPVAAA